MDRIVVENLNSVICVFSNDVGFLWGVYMVERPSVFFIRLGRLFRAGSENSLVFFVEWVYEGDLL